MKKNLILFAALLLFPLVIAGFLFFDQETNPPPPDQRLSNEALSWGFVRNQNHEQPAPLTNFENGRFNAYYASPNSEDKIIYLAFDCGYEMGYTPAILDALETQGVKAAFFVTESYIKDNPELVIRMKEEGHLVGNHTVSHTALPELSDEEIADELTACENAMLEYTGYEMDRFLRPPEGIYSQRTLRAAEKLGYTTIFWSIAYRDWDTEDQPTAEYVVEQFAANHHPGAITLIHVVSSANAQALPRVISLLKKAGYSFGMLNQLA